MERILIAGCGYVGSALAERLLASGDEVWGIRRTVSALPGGTAGIAADLSTGEGLNALPGDIDVLVYTAGATGHTEAAYRAAYVDGLQRMLMAVDRSRLRRVVFTSSTAVYAQNDGGWVDEDSPAEARHFSGRMMLDAEQLLANCGVTSVALRLGGIYGPGRTRLIDSVAEGTARIDPGPPKYLNLNHRDDCASALDHLLRIENPAPVYVGCDPNPTDRGVVLRWIASQLGVAAPSISMEADPAASTRGGNRRCSSRRLVSTGFVHRWQSFREGYGALIASRQAE